MNLNATIIPKSDQQNYDDFISGPRTIKITNVLPGSKEQPINVTFEGDNAKPFKPSKSMRRVLITLWGSEGDAYIGRSLTLYGDPTVKYAGEAVGGIKISHASHIAAPMDIMLTETRGKRKPHHVDVLVVEAGKPEPLATFPPEWTGWSNEERGANRASLGSAALKEWFTGLPSEDKKTLKPLLDGTWKPIAEAVK